MVVSFSLNHRAVLKTPSPPPPPPDMKVSSYMCNIILISCYFKVKKLHNVAFYACFRQHLSCFMSVRNDNPGKKKTHSASQ